MKERVIDRSHRETVFLEDAAILSRQAHQGGQWILRLDAPECARHAQPGSFVHLRCDPRLAMRRPFSIMRADPRAGWIELLYKVVGEGTDLLSRRQVGDKVSVLGPIGRPFALRREYPRPLLIGGGVGMPPMIFLADRLRHTDDWQPFVILGSEVPFPFQPRLTQEPVAGVPSTVNAVMPLLEDWDVPSRLASGQGYGGCFVGRVTDLAQLWLAELDDAVREEVAIFACGPEAMLASVAQLARDWQRPCQISLEEYMACGIGGCAGCVVPVQTADGRAMKRVCVDGPVFDAYQIFV